MALRCCLSRSPTSGTLLRWLRSQAPRLVLRVNTRPADEVHADQAPSVVFGDSMTLPTAAELKQVLEAAGWRIKHWQNERSAATPTLDAYRARLNALPINNTGTQLELLRSLVELNDQRKSNNGSWTVTHGLLTVVAVSGDTPKRTSATHRRADEAAVVPSACEASLDEAVVQLERLLSVATQADAPPRQPRPTSSTRHLPTSHPGQQRIGGRNTCAKSLDGGGQSVDSGSLP